MFSGGLQQVAFYWILCYGSYSKVILRGRVLMNKVLEMVQEVAESSRNRQLHTTKTPL